MYTNKGNDEDDKKINEESKNINNEIKVSEKNGEKPKEDSQK